MFSFLDFIFRLNYDIQKSYQMSWRSIADFYIRHVEEHLTGHIDWLCDNRKHGYSSNKHLWSFSPHSHKQTHCMVIFPLSFDRNHFKCKGICWTNHMIYNMLLLYSGICNQGWITAAMGGPVGFLVPNKWLHLLTGAMVTMWQPRE